MRSTLISVFVALLLPIGLAGCLPTGGNGPAIKARETATPVFTATPGLTPAERNSLARDLLAKGEKEQARAELLASLAEQPAEKNSQAQFYLEQIEGDPIKMLGSENFDYQVKKGETLSTIARDYLGDPLRFYILARYNRMDNPNQLQVGQKIKVPGKERVVAPLAPPKTELDTAEKDGPLKPEPDIADDDGLPKPDPIIAEGEGGLKPEPDTADKDGQQTPPGGGEVVAIAPPPTPPPGKTPEEQATEQKMKLFSEAREKSDAGNYPDGVVILEKALTQFPEDQMFRVFGGDVYGKYGDNLLDQQKFPEALKAAQRGKALDPDNADLAKLIDDAKKGVRADALYEDGQKYEASQSYIEALESYIAALKAWPNHDKAQIALLKVRPKVADQYYRAARTAFQKHDLEKALEYYDKTLEVDASHEPAKLERQRTIQLIDKLKQAG